MKQDENEFRNPCSSFSILSKTLLVVKGKGSGFFGQDRVYEQDEYGCREVKTQLRS